MSGRGRDQSFSKSTENVLSAGRMPEERKCRVRSPEWLPRCYCGCLGIAAAAGKSAGKDLKPSLASQLGRTPETLPAPNPEGETP